MSEEESSAGGGSVPSTLRTIAEDLLPLEPSDEKVNSPSTFVAASSTRSEATAQIIEDLELQGVGLPADRLNLGPLTTRSEPSSMATRSGATKRFVRELQVQIRGLQEENAQVAHCLQSQSKAMRTLQEDMENQMLVMRSSYERQVGLAEERAAEHRRQLEASKEREAEKLAAQARQIDQLASLLESLGGSPPRAA